MNIAGMQPAPWIENLENAPWILEHSEELIAFYGEETFWADDPIPLEGDRESLQKSDPEAAAQAVAEAWLQELDFGLEGVSVSSMEEPGIYFDVEKEELQLQLYAQDLKDAARMPAAVALSFAALLISMNRPDSEHAWHEEEEMPITALVAILMGFGPYICEAERLLEQSGEEISFSGLTLEECCYAQAYVCFSFEQDFTTFQESFSPEVRGRIAEALGYMMQLEAADSTDSDGQ